MVDFQNTLGFPIKQTWVQHNLLYYLSKLKMKGVTWKLNLQNNNKIFRTDAIKYTNVVR